MTKFSLDSGKRATPADHAKGHRVRMRGKLLEKGSAAPTELEILEMLLYAGAPRGDTEPLAKRLISYPRVKGKPVSTHWVEVQDYCISKLAHEPIEYVMVLCLDNQTV